MRNSRTRFPSWRNTRTRWSVPWGRFSSHVDHAVVNMDNTVVAIREPLSKDLAELGNTLQAAHTVLADIHNVVGSNEGDIGEAVRNLRSASENVRAVSDSLKQRPWSLIRTNQPADRRVPQ